MCIFNELKSKGLLIDFEFEKFDKVMSTDSVGNDLDPERLMEIMEEIDIMEDIED